MKKFDLLKGGIGFMVSVGVGTLAGEAVKLIRPQKMSAIKKVACSIGGLIICDMASDKTVQYFEEKWDEGTESIKNFFLGKKIENVITGGDEVE